MNAEATADAGLDPRRWRILALLCTIYFMVILDAAIVRVGIPSIDADLNMSEEGLQWVANAYMLSFGALLLLGGRAADLLGRRRMFILGVTVFTLASLWCGLAWSGGSLIAARAVQGVGAAMMTPAALSILMRTFPEGAERNKAVGIWGAIGGLGATAAWIVGGPLIDGPGWEWIFLINIPVGIAVLAGGLALFDESREEGMERNYDPAGALTITGALVLLVYALVEAPEAGWGSIQTVSLFAVSAALFIAFFGVERRAKAPLMPMRVVRSRTLVAANIGLAFAAASVYGMSFILALYGQEVLGYSALEFGFAGVVMPLTAGIGAGIGQALVTKRGSRPVSAVAMGMLAASFVMLAQLAVDSSYASDILPALILFGPPLGAAFTAYTIATLAGVGAGDAGLAAGLNNTFEQVGGALGTAVMATVAAAKTADLVSPGTTGPEALFALNEGFQLAFGVAVAFPVIGLLVSVFLLGKVRPPALATEAEPATAAAAAE